MYTMRLHVFFCGLLGLALVACGGGTDPSELGGTGDATVQAAGDVRINASQIGNGSIEPSFSFVSGGTRVDTGAPGSAVATQVSLNPQLPPDLAQREHMVRLGPHPGGGERDRACRRRAVTKLPATSRCRGAAAAAVSPAPLAPCWR